MCGRRPFVDRPAGRRTAAGRAAPNVRRRGSRSRCRPRWSRQHPVLAVSGRRRAWRCSRPGRRRRRAQRRPLHPGVNRGHRPRQVRVGPPGGGELGGALPNGQSARNLEHHRQVSRHHRTRPGGGAGETCTRSSPRSRQGQLAARPVAHETPARRAVGEQARKQSAWPEVRCGPGPGALIRRLSVSRAKWPGSW